MKNKEKYQNKIFNVIAEGGICNFKKRFIFKKDDCQGLSCEQCKKLTKKWLEQEYKEPIKLTHDEYIILKNIDEKYQWISRDKDEKLCISPDKPYKYITIWRNDEGYWHSLKPFNHLFQFIKWEDEEPYNIQELLKNCEVV